MSAARKEVVERTVEREFGFLEPDGPAELNLPVEKAAILYRPKLDDKNTCGTRGRGIAA